MSFRLSEEQYKNILKQTKQDNKKNKSLKKGLTIKISEPEIQNNIRSFLQMNGWYVIRHQQSMGSLKGLSDLTAIKNGKTIYIEVKTPKGYQSQFQKDFQRDIEAHGGLYILARSIEDVEKYI